LRYNDANGDLTVAKRTNRVGWGLVAVLGIEVLVGIGLLSSHYRCLILLRQQEWGFGRTEVWARAPAHGVPPTRGPLIEHRWKLGPIAFRWK
jgi:hypothetical protein